MACPLGHGAPGGCAGGGGGGEAVVPERIRRLLNYIVSEYAVVDEVKDIDLNASATGGGAMAERQAEVAQRERERADALAEPFQRGLLAAWRARLAGRAELPLDDRVPDENAMADALIQFLVSFDLAESRTEETAHHHYVYHVAVDWDRLNAVGRAAGLDLDADLAQLAR